MLKKSNIKESSLLSYSRLIEHYNPQLEDAIRSLFSAVNGFIKTCVAKLVPFKGAGFNGEDDTSIVDLVIDIRKNQVDVDKKALELYDISMKLNSFLCMTNRMGKNQPLKKIDRLKMYFSSDGQKNKHVRSVLYL